MRCSARMGRFCCDRGGNFATMAALVAPLLIIVGAVAVDEGALYTERREVQTMTDLAAIAGAASIRRAEEAVLLSLGENGLPDVVLIEPGAAQSIDFARDASPRALVEVGRYERDRSTAPELRFTPLATPGNAVRVTLYKQGNRYFSRGLIASPRIAAVGVASAPAEAAFSVGSRLARIDAGLLNALLGKLAGGTVSLDVMDYEALIDADVSLLSFLDVLVTQLDLDAVTYEDVLQADATVGEMAAAMANVSGLSSRAKLGLKALAAGAGSTVELPLDQMLALGTLANLALGERTPGLDAKLSVMDFLTGSFAAANGARQLSLDLAGGIPGLVSTKLDLAIGQPPQNSPWYRVGEKGDVVRTAQTRLLLTLQVGASGILGTSIRLPVYVEAAYAEAELDSITCEQGNPATAKVWLDATPGIAEIRIADISANDLSDFSRPPALAKASLVTTLLLTVKGRSLVSMSNTLPTRVAFNRSEISSGTVKTISTHDFLTSTVTSLVQNLKLEINILGLGIGLTTPALVTAAVSAVLLPVAPIVDGVLYSTLSALGLKLGQADLRVTGVSCGRPVLVQ